MSAKLQVGAPAPDFTMTRDGGGEVRLSDLKGKSVVLYFYPKDDTPGCTIQACEFTESVAAFEAVDATVFGCSPDTPASHREFIAKHELRIDLLSDPEHSVMELYGAWGEKVLYGRKSVGAIRSTVLIAPDGSVAHHWKRARAKGNAAAVQKKLDALRS